MKFAKQIFLLISLCGAAFSAAAKDVDISGTGNKSWSSLGLEAGDNITATVTAAKDGDSLTITNISGSFELGNVTVNAAETMGRLSFAMEELSNLKINGDLNVSSETFFYGGTLEIAGNVNITTVPEGKVSAFGYNSSGTLEKFIVGGNFYTSYNAQWSEAAMIATFSSSRTQEEYNAAYWSDADIDIKGSVTVEQYALKIYTSINSGSKYTKNVYAKFGALVATNSNARVNVMISNQPQPVEGGILNLMITGNGADYANSTATFAGSLATQSNGGMHLLMNSGDGGLIQVIQGNANIYDGVTMMSGTLLLNFNNSSNHGDLNMQGGRFGSSVAAGGTFGFNDIVYKGGTISLVMESATAFDTLTLAGTIRFADDAAAGAKVTFDFGSDLMWLVDSSANGGLGEKIISFSSPTSLSDGDFAANFYENSGDTYMADFTVLDDGLYVKYVAVPEPAEIAAVIGALALAFAARRRSGRGL